MTARVPLPFAITALVTALLATAEGSGADPVPTPVDAKSSPAQTEKPRLVVLVIFDQLRPDYIEKWQPYFGEGGFQRFGREGATYTQCFYPYANTVTAAGHATIATGAPPRVHAIVSNEWWDRVAGKEISCVATTKFAQVPAGGASSCPFNLRAETFADALKQATKGAAKVVALSGKDRSSVLPGGKRPDACYWFDTDTGSFVTSTYYREELHDWAARWNAAREIDTSFGEPWKHFRPDLDYDAIVGPDDAPGEGVGTKQGTTFPHPMNGGLNQPGTSYWRAIYSSPRSNELLWSLAKAAIEGESLGADETTDLLSISFSGNDVVGHNWGPDSHEVLDITLRSDKILEDMLTLLDEKVGKGRYVVAISADHGVCPLPEWYNAHLKPNGTSPNGEASARALRINPKEFVKAAEAFMGETFGAPGSQDGPWITIANFDAVINQKLLAARNHSPAAAEEKLAAWVARYPGIQAAYTRTDLLDAEKLTGDPIAALLRESFHPERSGDVTAVLKPYCLSSGYPSGTTHGTPHDYDRHVPLLFFGAGVAPGKHADPTTPLAIVPAFARIAGIAPPTTATYPPPPHLGGQAPAND